MTPDDSLYQYLSQPAHENTPSIIDLLNQPPTPPPPKNNSTAISNIPSTLNQLSNPSFVNETIPDNSCPFISRLSTDARSQIYSYLLLNPILSKAECISPETDFGIKQKYELEPAVLRICKEVYGEASAVLYDLNTFYLVAMKSTRMLRLTLADFISGSALTRYWRENADIFRVAPASTLYSKRYLSSCSLNKNTRGIRIHKKSANRSKNWFAACFWAKENSKPILIETWNGRGENLDSREYTLVLKTIARI